MGLAQRAPYLAVCMYHMRQVQLKLRAHRGAALGHDAPFAQVRHEHATVCVCVCVCVAVCTVSTQCSQLPARRQRSKETAWRVGLPVARAFAAGGLPSANTALRPRRGALPSLSQPMGVRGAT